MQEEPVVSVKDRIEEKPRRQPLYHVILINDDQHTVEYVINMCQRVFGHTLEKGLEIAREVHLSDKAILWTGVKEIAELRQEQVHAFGKDHFVATCEGSMTAIIEPSI